MKTNNLIALLLIFISSNLFSQNNNNNSYFVEYEGKLNPNKEIFIAKYKKDNINENYIENEMLKTFSNIDTYNLIFNKNESTFYKIQKVDNTQNSEKNMFHLSTETREIITYKNSEKNEFLEDFYLDKDKFIIFDSIKYLESIDSGKKDSICGFETIESTYLDKNMNFTLWYTKELPGYASPFEFSNRKGVILKMHIEYLIDNSEVKSLDIECKNLRPLKNKEKIIIPNRGKKVSPKELDIEIKKWVENIEKLKEWSNQGVDSSN